MKAVLKRKFIYLEPKPTQSIKQGLWFEIEPKGTASLPYYYSDVRKGKVRYSIPAEVLSEKAKIKRVFFKVEGKELNEINGE